MVEEAFFFWLLEVSIVNSFILMRLQLLKQGEKEQRHLQYRRNLIEQLVGDVRARAGKWGPSARLYCEQRLDGKPHFIYKLPGRSSKDCAVCSDRKTKGAGGKQCSSAKPAEIIPDCTQESALNASTHCPSIAK